MTLPCKADFFQPCSPFFRSQIVRPLLTIKINFSCVVDADAWNNP